MIDVLVANIEEMLKVSRQNEKDYEGIMEINAVYYEGMSEGFLEVLDVIKKLKQK